MSKIKPGNEQTVIFPSDAEERRIQAGIAADPEAPELDESFFAHARPAREVLAPALFEALVGRRRGRPPGSTAEHSKTLVSIRLDPEVVDAARSSGPGWQTRINEVLRREFLKSS